MVDVVDVNDCVHSTNKINLRRLVYYLASFAADFITFVDTKTNVRLDVDEEDARFRVSVANADQISRNGATGYFRLFGHCPPWLLGATSNGEEIIYCRPKTNFFAVLWMNGRAYVYSWDKLTFANQEFARAEETFISGAYYTDEDTSKLTLLAPFNANGYLTDPRSPASDGTAYKVSPFGIFKVPPKKEKPVDSGTAETLPAEPPAEPPVEPQPTSEPVQESPTSPAPEALPTSPPTSPAGEQATEPMRLWDFSQKRKAPIPKRKAAKKKNTGPTPNQELMDYLKISK